MKLRNLFIILSAVLLLFSCRKAEVREPAIKVVSSSLHASPAGGVVKAVVKAAGRIDLECEAPWCECEIVSDTLSVLCLPNNTISERFAIITLRCNGDKVDLSLSQDGQYSNLLNIPSTVVTGCNAVKLSYDISTNVGLSAKSDQSGWCRVGVSSTMVMITLTENPDMEARDCNVEFYTASKTVKVKVHQKGRFVLDCDKPLVFPKIGGDFKCEFYSAEPYTVSTDDEWVKYEVVGDSLKVYAERNPELAAMSSKLTVTTESGYSKSIDVTQKLLPGDYLGSFDFCFRSGWDENYQIYEYAVEAEWDEERSEIGFDLVSYYLRFQYDPSDGFLYLHPQLAYVSKTNPYNTWLGIVGTQMLPDGTPDPTYVWPNPEIKDWTNYYEEGGTFDTRYRMLFQFKENSLDTLSLTHIPGSDFPLYNARLGEDGNYHVEYGNPEYFLKDCYGFRLGLFHVYYNSMDDDRIDPVYVPGNHYPVEYRVDQHLPMYGPITLVRK